MKCELYLIKAVVKNRKLTMQSVVESVEQKECIHCGENTKCWWHYPVKLNIRFINHQFNSLAYTVEIHKYTPEDVYWNVRSSLAHGGRNLQSSNAR